MSKEFFDAVKAIEAEKGIPAEYLYEKISAAIIVAAKHDYNGKDIVHCDIDPDKQKIKVYVRKNVVDEIEDEDTDLTLEQAQVLRKSAKVGGTIDIPLKTKNFGRIVAQTAKHVIRQGIREAERGQMIEEFKSKNQELVTAKETELTLKQEMLLLIWVRIQQFFLKQSRFRVSISQQAKTSKYLLLMSKKWAKALAL